ncbi:DUF190 domain-containing protein [Prosthecochloris sp. GSB1]|uniref:DUF190 domain-containing protein n=1 Tax=Prosthecochloris sp. GSB1 TaxID=281093 RepID=UPI001F390DEA|nr:DUF190 domain-containing protein [Prosthecochloris sp. GSB1]
MAMQFENRLRLRIHAGERTKHRHRALYEVIVERAGQEGLAGATVLKGILSYGISGKVHAARVLELSPDLPVVIEIIDDRWRVEAFLPVLESLVRESGAHVHLTMEDVRAAVVEPDA